MNKTEERYSGKLDYTAIAIDPIHHGAGSEGNTQLLRTQDILLPDGTPTRVPFISGNSIKHMIRDGGVRFALEAMGINAGALSKALVDLMFSGGALTKSGSAVNLAHARKIAEIFPILSLCGYSAGNFMQASKINVSHLHLVCSENTYRIPVHLREDPQINNRAMVARAEDFGTRHEPTTDSLVFGLLTTDSQEKQNADTRMNQHKKQRKSQQMIYDFEVIRPGSKWFGDIIFNDLTQFELASLRSALERAAVSTHDGALLFHIGAKSSVGMGRMAFTFTGGLRSTLSTPSFSPSEAIMPSSFCADSDVMSLYIEHLRNNREAILNLLELVV